MLTPKNQYDGSTATVFVCTTRAGVDCDSPVLFWAVHADARPNEQDMIMYSTVQY